MPRKSRTGRRALCVSGSARPASNPFIATIADPRRFYSRLIGAKSAGVSMETQSSTLLVFVEDEALLHMEIQETLSEGGFDVKLATNAKEGIALLESHKNVVRGLITDVNLGKGARGWEVARRARELIPDLPVVYITGGYANQWTSQGVPKSIMIEKPFAFGPSRHGHIDADKCGQRARLSSQIAGAR